MEGKADCERVERENGLGTGGRMEKRWEAMEDRFSGRTKDFKQNCNISYHLLLEIGLYFKHLKHVHILYLKLLYVTLRKVINDTGGYGPLPPYSGCPHSLLVRYHTKSNALEFVCGDQNNSVIRSHWPLNPGFPPRRPAFMSHGKPYSTVTFSP